MHMLPRQLDLISYIIITILFDNSQVRDIEKKIKITEENLRDLLKKLVRRYIALYIIRGSFYL